MTDAGDVWRERRATTLAMCTLVLLVAFESLAVTTVMPSVSDALDGARLYSFAFAGPLATGVVGMVVAGPWADRAGPRAPLLTAIGLFVAGLVVAGTATSMTVLVLGRLVQGLGGGACTVALYVIVARLYPPLLHPRVFAGFSAAWVVPSLVGPSAAGLVAQHLGWRWVFLGVVALVVPVTAVLQRPLAEVGRPASDAAGAPVPRRRLLWAVVAAGAVAGLNVSATVDPPLGWLLAGAAAVLAVVAVRPLVPPGTLRAARGLPSVVATRGLVAGAFFGAEVYLPYLLTDVYGFAPATAGVALTTAAIAWAGASWWQGRLGARLADRDAVRLGTAFVAVAVAGCLAVTALGLPAGVAVGAWTLAGLGMGLAYARLSVLVLARSAPGTQGANTSALSVADSMGAAIALATTGILFAAVEGKAPGTPFAASFAWCALLALTSAVVAPRVAAALRGGSAQADPDGTRASTART